MSIFKKILELLFKSESELPTLGSKIDEVDIRDWVMTDISFSDMFKNNPPNKFIVDELYELPVMDQKSNGSCVGQAEGEVIQLFEYREKKKEHVSRRDLYANCKLVDGSIGEGTSPRFASSIMKNKGVAGDDLVKDDNNMNHSNYIDIPNSPEIVADRAERKVLSYMEVPRTAEFIKRAIFAFGSVCFTTSVDWSKGWRHGTDGHVSRTISQSGLHRLILSGYDENKFFFKNSWGERWGEEGFGSFDFDDMRECLNDLRVYVDVPNKKEETGGYVFTQFLKVGSRGYEVIQLQKRLDITTDGIFGPITARSVMSYQASNGLLSDGIVGNNTRSVLNSQSKSETKPTFTAWAKAIQQFEGWFEGSLSQKNNNPGNLRAGKGQIGVYKNFAVFENYEAGFNALLNQLRVSATSNGPSYNSEMTLLEFFSVYAPSADNNHPRQYATFVAQKLRVGIDYKINKFI